MCRNIKPLFNFNPPATDAEVRDAALQFVRKLSGFTSPSQRNRQAFDSAVTKIAAAARELVDCLETDQPPKDREEEAAKARARSALRFPKQPAIVFE
jgi:hypothetical protein